MPIPTTCPACHSSFTLADTMKGRKIRCGKCGQVFVAQQKTLQRRSEPKDPEPVERDDGIIPLLDDKPRSRSRTPVPIQRPPSSGSRRRFEEFEEDPPEREPSPSSTNNVPWLVGGAVACVAMLVVGGIVIATLLRDSRQSGDVAQVIVAPNELPPVVEVKPSVPTLPVEKVLPETTPVPVEPRPPAQAGELSRDALKRVKRATVMLRVHLVDGTVTTGTGFFGAADAANILLTNAHVLGMLTPTSRKPVKIEVILNSGEKDEKRTAALVLGVDRASDLAVLDVGTTVGMPTPLTVKSGEGLQELDKVYVFGFPLGEKLGKEITIRPSSVSSLRKTFGILDRIQVAGGMDPGNSGGPVVDASGQVVGVAVAGIPGMLINFAIPGERVHSILNGRLAEMGFGQAFKQGEEFGVPVTLAMVDPRSRVKEVGVEVWTGEAGSGSRPPSATQPEPVGGDSSRGRVTLGYAGAVGRGEVMLPSLPQGRVWWIQPFYRRTSGEMQWAQATVYKHAEPPVERKSISLFSRYNHPGARRLAITASTRFKASGEAETELAALVSKATLTETGTGNPGAITIKMAYREAEQTATVNKKELSNPTLHLVKDDLKKLVGVVEIDGTGNVKSSFGQVPPALQGQPNGQRLLAVHQPIQYAVYPLLLTMPNRRVNALESWKVSRMLGVPVPTGLRRGTLELTCTYLGVRTVAGREEAVITLDGQIRDNGMTGRARGMVLVDTMTGVLVTVNLDMEVDMPPMELELEEGKKTQLRTLSVVSLRLERSL